MIKSNTIYNYEKIKNCYAFEVITTEEDVMRIGKNFATRTKVLLAFGTVFVATSGRGLAGLGQIALVKDEALGVRSNWLPSAVSIGKLSPAVESFRSREAPIAISALGGNAAQPSQDATVFAATKTSVDRLRRDYRPIILAGAGRGRLVRAFDAAWSRVHP